MNVVRIAAAVAAGLVIATSAPTAQASELGCDATVSATCDALTLFSCGRPSELWAPPVAIVSAVDCAAYELGQ